MEKEINKVLAKHFSRGHVGLATKELLVLFEKQQVLPEKVVYLVECSSGSWDSYHWWVGGIFESEVDANKYAQELNEENKRLKEVECPIKTPAEDMTDEEETEYYRWWNGNNDAMEWNGAKVKQYPVNVNK